MRATHFVNPDREELKRVILELTEGRGADLVVEAVGQNTETINQCLDLVCRGGTILAFGIADEAIYPFRYRDWFSKNVTLISTVGPDVQKDFGLSLRWIAEGRVDVTPLITHRKSFKDVQAAFEMCLAKADGVVKCVLEYE
jgi:threonine dehydrogenase-like Zn-dependent dehydrogenase